MDMMDMMDPCVRVLPILHPKGPGVVRTAASVIEEKNGREGLKYQFLAYEKAQ